MKMVKQRKTWPTSLISRNSRRSGAQHKHNILQLSALKSRKVLSCCGLRADVVVKTFNMVCS